MAARIFRRKQPFFSPPLLSRIYNLCPYLKRWKHTCSKEGEVVRLRDITWRSIARESSYDAATWKTLDSSSAGIMNSDISSPTWTVLKILQCKGFDAYLVGGCVRDLLLKRKPKDFDIVTTASLKQIKKNFHRSRVVGRRFPICHVQIRDCTVEVSSFNTTGRHVKERETTHSSQIPTNCDEKDFIRWKNCMERDFTINGVIYDYIDGIKDLKICKMHTIIPAHLSFTEDSARILRGLRIAARLGLQFSSEITAAIHELSSSIMTLPKLSLQFICFRNLSFLKFYFPFMQRIWQIKQKVNLLEVLSCLWIYSQIWIKYFLLTAHLIPPYG
ncbi:Polynucleotide adenylyltransferase protein [Dioscorea alata]|uniref:Polynucleotide adenylyltransferase protein n=2 Tax=Dioscorea alata TaxID=55571 RepID=A0ACB7WPN0_DIOAL|nr:Polynucleotide adenylyltransferase protein [Dioscorea alata]KAH7690303.1 Polynucleotide adenylyltransferase protein [Dioscorea alata]